MLSLDALHTLEEDEEPDDRHPDECEDDEDAAGTCMNYKKVEERVQCDGCNKTTDEVFYPYGFTFVERKCDCCTHRCGCKDVEECCSNKANVCGNETSEDIAGYEWFENEECILGGCESKRRGDEVNHCINRLIFGLCMHTTNKRREIFEHFFDECPQKKDEWECRDV